MSKLQLFAERYRLGGVFQSYTHLCRTIWNVFSPLTFCKHIFSVHDLRDFTDHGGNTSPGVVINAKDGKNIAFGDLVYVEMDQIHSFLDTVFPTITQGFVLVTSGFFLNVWDHPTTWESPEVPKKLQECVDSEIVIAWACKNAIDPRHPKCLPIPIGVYPLAIRQYAKVLAETSHQRFDTKEAKMGELYLAPNSDLRRTLGNNVPREPPEQFFSKMVKYKAIYSPTGVRADCFRHLEAIGLGTVPIVNALLEKSNVSAKDVLAPLYGESVLFTASIEEARSIAQFAEPDRDLIWTDTWIQKIQNKVNELSAKSSDTRPLPM